MDSTTPLALILYLLILIRPLTVFFHEMGHAITGWLVTRNKVEVFIGSFGNKEKSIRIPLKNFDFFIYKNPLKWGKGLCVTKEKKISINNQILFVLGGPFASLLVAAVSFLLMKLSGSADFFLKLLIASSLLDFFLNIIPTNKTLQLEGGNTTSNDGKTLINLFKLKRLPKEYSEGMQLYQEEKYTEAADIFENLLTKNEDANIYRMIIAANVQTKNFSRAKEIADKFKTSYKKLTSDDLANIGLTYTENRNLKESLELYDQSLKINPNNKFALNNKGYSLMLLEEFETSILFFDKAITVDKEFWYAYSNRGLAKIRTKQLEEGKKDIEYALKLNANNSDTYKNLGIYYFEKGEFKTALELYNKAKEIDFTTYLIDDLIMEVQDKIT